ncbi:dihydrofolate reductase family protein [Ferrovibrio sp.]|uniref:dihydrofolate reductase family protein n=1 Tax=Ferrovibrio sp. TaxID=1917215 RepID=UPI000CBE0986|nr:dihydrofolate reductase family protein [Ferrovibrio sp.]PJI39029.1 MAG: dihydrofolate reductase [Ferrovibrio sp.]
MARPLFRAYMAVSADGYIARADGSVEWLHDYNPVEFGYNDFYAGLGHIVMGRASYEQARAFGPDWHYAGKPCTVVTSQALSGLPAGVRTHTADFAALAQELRRTTQSGDVWLFGGARLWTGFLSAGAVDRFELYVVPILLGQGMPLLPKAQEVRLALRESETLTRGVVKLAYDVV